MHELSDNCNEDQNNKWWMPKNDILDGLHSLDDGWAQRDCNHT